MMPATYLAIDWGTTNRRVHRMGADGALLGSETDETGAASMSGRAYADEVEALRARHGDLPILIAGMAGSRQGWREAAYCPCPAGLDDLAAALLWVEPGRTAIVPGLRTPPGSRADVMRGEEVQILGAVEAGLAPADALLCQPGTHCKWAWLADGRIDHFLTAMPGELFGLLRRDSTLSTMLAHEVAADAAFLEGVERARNGDLLANLFAVRAETLLGQRDMAQSAAFASGLLIGADVLARPLDRRVALVADGPLADLYDAAIVHAGGEVTRIGSVRAFTVGIHAIWSRIDHAAFDTA